MKEANKRPVFLNGILWSTKSLVFNIPNTLIVTYMSFYATDVLGMAPALVATILLLTKVFDGFTDLISGFIVDNTHTRWGKGRPYDFCMVFIGLFTVLLFSAPRSGVVLQTVYLFVMYSLVQAVFVTLLETADKVYLLRAFPDEKERNNTFSIAAIFGQVVNITIGIILPVMIASAGTDHGAWTRTILMITVPVTMIGMLRFFFIKEVVVDEPATVKQHPGKKQKASGVGLKEGWRAISQNHYILILALSVFIVVISSGFLNTSGTYYFRYIVGDMSLMSVVGLGTYATLLMLVIFVPLSNKFGKSSVMKAGLVITCLGCLLRWVGGTNIVTLTVGMGMLMFGIMPISLYFPLFLFDIMDYGEWKTGTRVEGLYAAFPTFANKVASGLSVSLAMFILGASGYDGAAAVQTVSALRTIGLCYNAIPTILVIVMTAVIILFYDIDKKMPQVKAELKERHGAARDQLETEGKAKED